MAITKGAKSMKTTWELCVECGFNFLPKNTEYIKGIGNCCFGCASDIRTEQESERAFEFILGDLG
jgi:hypothetical protein